MDWHYIQNKVEKLSDIEPLVALKDDGAIQFRVVFINSRMACIYDHRAGNPPERYDINKLERGQSLQAVILSTLSVLMHQQEAIA